MTTSSKASQQIHLQEEIKTKVLDLIDNGNVKKTTLKHWKDPKTDIKADMRPNLYGKTEQKIMLCHNKDKGIHAAIEKQLYRIMQNWPPMQILQNRNGDPGTHPTNMPGIKRNM